MPVYLLSCVANNAILEHQAFLVVAENSGEAKKEAHKVWDKLHPVTDEWRHHNITVHEVSRARLLELAENTR